MIYVSIFLGIIVICLGMIAFMLITMIKQGDERNEIIISRSCRNTLFAMLGYLIVCMIEQVFHAFHEMEIEGVNPFWQMIILAVFYLIQLFYYKRKYGD